MSLRRTLVAVLSLTLGAAALAGPAAAAATPQPQATWSQVLALSTGSSVDGVTTTAPGHVWSVGSKRAADGYSRPYAFRTIAGVTTELPFSTDFSNRWGRFLSVDGVSDTDIWAVGLLTAKTSGAGSGLIAHWTGSSWSEVPVPADEIVSVSVRAADDVWFAGNGGDFGATQLYHWDGGTLSAVAVPVVDPICFAERTVSVDLTTTATGVWLATRCTLRTDARSAGSVQVLRGGAWSLAYSSGPSGGLVSIADNGAGTVLATGFRPTSGGSVPILVAGRSTLTEWASFNPADFYWDVAARGNTVYLVGQVNINNTSRILRLNGSTFVSEPVQGAAPLFGVAIDAGGGAWAVGPAFGGSFAGSDIGLWQRVA